MADHSEPPQIDDVLSAVKALVDGKAVPTTPVPRLLLTPALRVDSAPVVSSAAASIDAVLRRHRDAQWEEEEGDPAPSTAWETHVEADTSYFYGRAPAFGAGQDSPEAPFIAVEDDEASYAELGGFDESQLRALVKQVLREELQGDLGERITRNVRKLVRREIYRAMAAQELK